MTFHSRLFSHQTHRDFAMIYAYYLAIDVCAKAAGVYELSECEASGRFIYTQTGYEDGR